jgi:hypothetical protein
MSPPIRDGSGSSIGSIRLGDGSEISEVRTGAGDVLFSATTIPDSVIYQFDGQNLSGFSNGNTVSQLPDESGVTGSATNGSATYASNIRNSNAGVQFTGSEDYDLALNTTSQPFVIYSVVDLGTSSSNRVILGPSNTGPDSQHWYDTQQGEWGVRSGTSGFVGATDTTALLYTSVHDGVNSEVYLDNNNKGTTDAGTNDLGDSKIGSRAGSEFFEGGLMFLEIHDSKPANGVGSRGQEILNRFN